VQEGFKLNCCGETGGVHFGKGIYTAANASKADQYVQRRAMPTVERTILVARVLIGHSERLMTPLPGKISSGEYDSAHGVTRLEGGSVDHPEYIVYSESRILPVATISFSHTAACECYLCSKLPDSA